MRKLVLCGVTYAGVQSKVIVTVIYIFDLLLFHISYSRKGKVVS